MSHKFTKEEIERAHTIGKAVRRAKKLLKEGKEVASDTIEADEFLKEAKDLIGVDALMKKINKAREKMMTEDKKKAEEIKPEGESFKEEAKTEPINIEIKSEEVVPKATLADVEAVKQTIKGRMDKLLNSLSTKIDELKKKKVDISPIVKKVEDIKAELAKPVNQDDLEGLSKSLLAALGDIQRDMKQSIDSLKSDLPELVRKCQLGDEKACELVEEAKEEQTEAKTQNTENGLVKAKENKQIVPLCEALGDDALRKKVLEVLSGRAQEDEKFRDELASLVEKCRFGDKEACDVLEAKEEVKPQDEQKRRSFWGGFITHSNPLEELVNG